MILEYPYTSAVADSAIRMFLSSRARFRWFWVN